MPTSFYSDATSQGYAYFEPALGTVTTAWSDSPSTANTRVTMQELEAKLKGDREERAKKYGGMKSLEMIEARASKIGNGISPELYFKYVKKHFGVLEKMTLNARLKKLEEAFNKVVENGQTSFGEKLMEEIVRETKESMAYAKGFKYFIEQDALRKHKHAIRGGHISDTRFEKFTRIIPEDVLAAKKEAEKIFDGFVIYHVWNDEAEKQKEKKQKMGAREKAAMRDPVLFGYINESDRLYFIADWEDELCDLTFDEMVDALSLKRKDTTISKQPILNP